MIILTARQLLLLLLLLHLWLNSPAAGRTVRPVGCDGCSAGIERHCCVVAYVVVCVLVAGRHHHRPVAVFVRRRLLLLAVTSAVSGGALVLVHVRPIVLDALVTTAGSSCVLTPNTDFIMSWNCCHGCSAAN